MIGKKNKERENLAFRCKFTDPYGCPSSCDYLFPSYIPFVNREAQAKLNGFEALCLCIHQYRRWLCSLTKYVISDDFQLNIVCLNVYTASTLFKLYVLHTIVLTVFDSY